MIEERLFKRDKREWNTEVSRDWSPGAFWPWCCWARWRSTASATENDNCFECLAASRRVAGCAVMSAHVAAPEHEPATEFRNEERSGAETRTGQGLGVDCCGWGCGCPGLLRRFLPFHL